MTKIQQATMFIIAALFLVSDEDKQGLLRGIRRQQSEDILSGQDMEKPFWIGVELGDKGLKDLTGAEKKTALIYAMTDVSLMESTPSWVSDKFDEVANELQNDIIPGKEDTITGDGTGEALPAVD